MEHRVVLLVLFLLASCRSPAPAAVPGAVSWPDADVATAAPALGTGGGGTPRRPSRDVPLLPARVRPEPGDTARLSTPDGSPPPADAETDADAEERWTRLVKPYVFATGVEGRAGGERGTSDIEADFDDILDSLDIGGIVALELVPPDSPWRILVDLIFARLEEDGTAPGPLQSDVDATVDQLIVELVAAYEILDEGRLDLLGGVRYWDLSVELDADLPGGTRSLDRDVDWLDPLVGVRSRLPLDERVDLLLRADVGGFGVGSDFTYNLGAAVGWAVSERTEIVVGYRYLDVDYDDDILYDVALSGPIAGCIFRF